MTRDEVKELLKKKIDCYNTREHGDCIGVICSNCDMQVQGDKLIETITAALNFIDIHEDVYERLKKENDWQGDRISKLAKENEQLRKPQNFNTVKDMIKNAVDRGETLEDALDYLVNSIYAKGYIDAIRDMENEKIKMSDVSDSISKQAAIDAFWQSKVEFRPSQIDEVMRILERLPSAQPEQRWIPVSEALPNYGVNVLTCLDDGDMITNHIINEDTGEWFWDTYPILAWMPLPEPYNAESEDKE